MFCLSVQVLCDADLVFTNVVARWPGSVHDSRILRQSALFDLFARNPKPIDGFILGDSGYPLRDWLLTPMPNPQTDQQHNYNNRHRTTRQTVERAIGSLKRRWHCLRRIRMAPSKACNIFVVSVILQNRARLLQLPEPDEEDMDMDVDRDQPEVEGNVQAAALQPAERMCQALGRAAQDNLIQHFF